MRLTFNVSSHSEQGKRPEQSDRVVVAPFKGGLLAAVMDGVGSGKGGDVAAETVAGCLHEYSRSHSAVLAQDPEGGLRHAMGTALDELAGRIGATTCTALAIREDGRAALAHIGDTALWRLRGEELILLTEAHRHGRHQLTRALHGHGDAPWRASTEYEVRELDAALPGDVFLLASDGCYEEVPDLLKAAMRQARIEVAQNPAQVLVAASLAAGSTDNSSAVLVHVVEA